GAELTPNGVATVAQESRTPLTSLRMAVHMCLEGAAGELTAKQSELLYLAREDCDRLQSIVDELLDMSRIQSGRIDITLRRVAAGPPVPPARDTPPSSPRPQNITPRSETMPGLGGGGADADRGPLAFRNPTTHRPGHTPPG